MDVITHALSGAALGAACAPSEREQLPLMLVGAVAGMAPDLDALSALRGPVAAWRQHRVWLHGLPTLPAQALVIYLITQGLASTPLDPQMLWLTIIGGLLVHVLLDSVTSFGTVLGFPFQRRRWSTHSHFIVDPGILVLLTTSLVADTPAAGLGLSGAWLLLGIAIRRRVVQVLHRVTIPGGKSPYDLHVEPGPLAPFRWLAIVRMDSNTYQIAPVSWRGRVLAPWQAIRSHENPQIQARARSIPVIQAFLETVDCPCWTMLERSPTGATVLLEDLKWRIFPPFRPLAFMIHLGPQPGQDRAKQMPLGWTATPLQAKRRVTGQEFTFVIVTTAAPPWYTGTALNPLHRAKALARRGQSVCLVFPWLQASDQTAVYPSGICFASPDEQSRWIKQTFATGSVDIRFYPAHWSPRCRSIFPTGCFVDQIPACELLILEEPEHLSMYRPWLQLKHQVQAHAVLGIIHTHYIDYLRSVPILGQSSWVLARISTYLGWISQRQCHQIVRLSAAVDGNPQSQVIAVNGVDEPYLAQRPDTQTTGLYFIGKLIWEKGWAEMIELLAQTPGQTLHVFGMGSEETINTLRAMASSNNIHLAIHGPSARPWLDLRSFRVFINCSRSEVLCTTTAEALAMGKFALVPKHPSNEFFAAHPNCLVYDSPEEFQRHLFYAQSMPPAPVDARPSLSWDAATQRLLDALQPPRNMHVQALEIEPPCSGVS